MAEQAILDAFEAIRPIIQQVWDVIVDTFQAFMRSLNRIYQALRKAHLIPRQYQLTMMRRKVRRYQRYQV